FDAVVLDVRMPDMDGLEVLRRIRELQPLVPVVILTGVQNEAVAREAIRLGAQNFLTKPCDIGMLQVSLEYAWAQQQT
ncbi:MAG: response regulator, partial [bacterium]|nr:response regulator [bacterium]